MPTNYDNKSDRDEAMMALKHHFIDKKIDFSYLEGKDLQTSLPILDKAIKYMQDADKIVIMDAYWNLEEGRATIESEVAHTLYRSKVIESHELERWIKDYRSQLSMYAEELKYRCVQAGPKALVYVRVNDDEYAVSEAIPEYQDGVITKITLVTKNKEKED